jgi:5-formyltetrahydrofolate cyclo-ligase
MHPAMDMEKRQLRKRLIAERMKLPHAAMNMAGESVARHFADHPILAFAPSFAGYVAMRGEVDVKPIFLAMERYAKQTSLPCITEQKSLLFRRWSVGDPLQRHAIGSEEPTPHAPSVIPAVILVPLLAFDDSGARLGYGGGYYDRTMNTMRRFETPPLFIGVGYSMQEIPHVPTEPHDALLDGVLTELGVSMFHYA